MLHEVDCTSDVRELKITGGGEMELMLGETKTCCFLDDELFVNCDIFELMGVDLSFSAAKLYTCRDTGRTRHSNCRLFPHGLSLNEESSDCRICAFITLVSKKNLLLLVLNLQFEAIF